MCIMSENGTYLKTEEVAEILDVSITTVTRMIARGNFPGTYKNDPTRKNSGFRIPRKAVEKFLKLRVVTPEEPEED